MNNLEWFIHVALAMAVIITTARFIGYLMTRINQPRVVGEMIAGVLLGPTLLGNVFPEVTHFLFSETSTIIYILGNLGLTFYMFHVGSTLDFEYVDKKIRKQSIALTIISTSVPMVFGCLVAFLFYTQLGIAYNKLQYFMFYIGTAFSIMAFPMLARILDENKLLRSQLGTLAMLSASGQDVITWILLAFISSLSLYNSVSKGWIALIGGFVFALVYLFIIKPILKKFSDSIQNKDVNYDHIAIILVMVLLSGVLADYIGIYCVFGGFMMGTIMPRNSILSDKVRDAIQYFVLLVLLPMFFAYSGLRTNMLAISSGNLLGITVVFLIFAYFSKYVPVLFTMKLSGYSWAKSSAIAGLMNARGLMILIVANIGLEYKIIETNIYSILVLIAITTTLSAMPIYNLSMRYDENK